MEKQFPDALNEVLNNKTSLVLSEQNVSRCIIARNGKPHFNCGGRLSNRAQMLLQPVSRNTQPCTRSISHHGKNSSHTTSEKKLQLPSQYPI